MAHRKCTTITHTSPSTRSTQPVRRDIVRSSHHLYIFINFQLIGHVSNSGAYL